MKKMRKEGILLVTTEEICKTLPHLIREKEKKTNKPDIRGFSPIFFFVYVDEIA